MLLTDKMIQTVIYRLIKGEDYEKELDQAFDQELSQDVPTLLIALVRKKISNQAINSDLSLEIVPQFDDPLYESIKQIIYQSIDLDLKLTIKFRNVSVDLNLSETLIVVNALAVKRAALRGGAWSMAGKRVEKMLFQTLCHLYQVPAAHMQLTGQSDLEHELDFILIDADKRVLKVEIKLMGRGNPESANAALAHQNEVFIADTLSDLNKRQLEARGIAWVELRSPDGYRKFYSILQSLNVPCSPFDGDLDGRLSEIFTILFPI